MFFRITRTDQTYAVDSGLEHFAVTSPDQVSLNCDLQFVLQYFVDGCVIVEVYTDTQWSVVRPRVITALVLSPAVLVSVFWGACIENWSGKNREESEEE